MGFLSQPQANQANNINLKYQSSFIKMYSQKIFSLRKIKNYKNNYHPKQMKLVY